jgi:predicted alpha-1,2-mannosidase
MKVLKICIAFSFVSLFYSCNSGGKENSELVDPFIGTDFHGHTYPGATVPFGMVQLSPDTRRGNWDACSGYHYSDSSIIGFSHTHLSGTGVIDFGDVLFHPTIKELDLQDKGYIFPPLSFSHNDETAEPGYYQVEFKEEDIVAELTASNHVGVHRYTFPKSTASKIIIDLAHNLSDESIDSLYLSVARENEIEGLRITNGWTPNQHVYFVARFSKPFDQVDLVANGKILPEKTVTGKNIQSVCHYSTFDGEQIQVNVGISFVSIENARENLNDEVPRFDFDKARMEAKEKWNKKLKLIEVKGGTLEQRQIFYTAMYHSMVTPNIVNDVNREYRNHKMTVDTVDRNRAMYSTLSLWDTFRTWHPLITLIDRDLTNDIINSMLRIYDVTGELPVWPLASGETGTMIGYHSVSVIADAYLKGIDGFDAEKALIALKASSNRNRKGKQYYIEHGFIPADIKKESVSCLLEYAYDDWCIAQMAKKMGHFKDYNEYIERAKSYLKIFDGSTRFFRGKRLDGNWINSFDPLEVSRDFTEANAWQYRFFVPHDIEGLINLFGGREAFVTGLDSLFNHTSDSKGKLQDITGLIGQYAHGNEPSHHVAFLYNYVGQPWKSQQRVRQILSEMYSATPGGIVGNEDCGQMSAWYIMSSIGLYPVCPGSGEYLLTPPLFEKTVINLHNRNRLVIRANGPEVNPYIDKVLFNGKEISVNYITHSQLMQGGELEFILTPQPNLERGINFRDAPYSLTNQKFVSVPYVEQDLSLFADPVKCTLGCATEGAEIRYTLDGSKPDENSVLDGGELVINGNLELKVRAFKEGYLPSPVFSIKAKKAKLRKADRSVCNTNGVRYRYFEGLFNRVDDISRMKPVKEGVIEEPSIEVAEADDHFGIEYTGFIYAPDDGVYEFYTSSDDGSVFFIGNTKVVNNDLSHAKITATGRIALMQGCHRFKLLYFEDYEGQSLELGWKIPGEKNFKKIGKQDVFIP